MTHRDIPDEELLAYLDEQLPVARLSDVESALRESPALRGRLQALARRRDQGVHSVGEIWRRGRLSCPSRSELGSFLLGALEGELASYIQFHIHNVGCRACAANLDDLQHSQAVQAAEEVTQRRRKYFESSAGYLPHASRED